MNNYFLKSDVRKLGMESEIDIVLYKKMEKKKIFGVIPCGDNVIKVASYPVFKGHIKFGSDILDIIDKQYDFLLEVLTLNLTDSDYKFIAEDNNTLFQRLDLEVSSNPTIRMKAKSYGSRFATTTKIDIYNNDNNVKMELRDNKYVHIDDDTLKILTSKFDNSIDNIRIHDEIVKFKSLDTKLNIAYTIDWIASMEDNHIGVFNIKDRVLHEISNMEVLVRYDDKLLLVRLNEYLSEKVKGKTITIDISSYDISKIKSKEIIISYNDMCITLENGYDLIYVLRTGKLYISEDKYINLYNDINVEVCTTFSTGSLMLIISNKEEC